MDLGLRDKTVLVMGSSAGLGKAAALEFSKEGAKVMLFSTNEEKLQSAQMEIKKITGCEPAYTVGDITVVEDIQRVVKNTVEQFGSIYALVNNAGGPPAGTFDNFTDDMWQKAYELNLLSYIRTIREVLPIMRNAGRGRILNYTSSPQGGKIIVDLLTDGKHYQGKVLNEYGVAMDYEAKYSLKA